MIRAKVIRGPQKEGFGSSASLKWTQELQYNDVYL